MFDKKKENPFEKECKDCVKNIWEQLNQKTEELNKKCYPNAFVWIEKFKEDN